MRLLQILLLAQVMSTFTCAQNHSFLAGETQDCFAGTIIHPAQVDIYLLDPLKSPEIVALLNDMEKQMPNRDDPNAEKFFASYQHLTSLIRKTNKLGHTQSDKAGRFSFHDLQANTKTILLGISEREDDPAYYAYVSLKLGPGKNPVTLDFDRGNVCKSPSTPH
jgi:hypothetical protein